jgi:hypothetical protein
MGGKGVCWRESRKKRKKAIMRACLQVDEKRYRMKGLQGSLGTERPGKKD